jgi:hypothetical protein
VRLRKKKTTGKGGEVPIPAREALQRDERLGSRMPEIFWRDVSTRQYQEVLPDMVRFSTVGVSKSQVSAEATEAGEEELKKLCERYTEFRLLQYGREPEGRPERLPKSGATAGGRWLSKRKMAAVRRLLRREDIETNWACLRPRSPAGGSNR